jgi:Amt family ammonium transporter
MVWGGGILFQLGALDFAGGTVVHLASGVSALVVALVMGRRVAGHHVEPHDVPMTVLGAGLLWFGWYGFNAGSAIAANGLASQALMVTTIAAAAATLTWVGAAYLRGRKVSVVGAAAGAVAGLVAITPAAGFVTVGGALIIGLVAGGICFAATLLRDRLAIDDALDVFSVHGVGGAWGAIGVGIFAVASIGGYSGLIEGNVNQLINQLIAVAFTVVFCSVMTFVIIKAIDIVLGLRVDTDTEEAGLDIAVHGETAYVPWSGAAGALGVSESVASGPDASGGPRNLSATEAKPA